MNGAKTVPVLKTNKMCTKMKTSYGMLNKYIQCCAVFTERNRFDHPSGKSTHIVCILFHGVAYTEYVCHAWGAYAAVCPICFCQYASNVYRIHSFYISPTLLISTVIRLYCLLYYFNPFGGSGFSVWKQRPPVETYSN